MLRIVHVELAWLLVIAGFALWGALGRILLEWPDVRDVWKAVGTLMTSIFAAWVLGLILRDRFDDTYPGLTLAATGLAGFFGRDFIYGFGPRLLRWLTNTRGGGTSERRR